MRLGRWLSRGVGRLAGWLAQSFLPHSALAGRARWQRMMRRARHFHSQGRYPETQSELAQMKELLASYPAPERGRLLCEVGELEETLLGRFEEAEQCYRQAAGMLESVGHQEAAQLARTWNNLALLYHNQRRYREAEPLFQQLLTLVEREFGEEDPEFATCLENYAILLQRTERQREANQLRVRALALRRKLERPGRRAPGRGGEQK